MFQSHLTGGGEGRGGEGKFSLLISPIWEDEYMVIFSFFFPPLSLLNETQEHNFSHFHLFSPSTLVKHESLVHSVNDFLLKALTRNSFRYLLWPPQIRTTLQKP
ncbi:hypothetical protein Hanom_Chr15g01373481 [Helianthus anomalus]